MASINDLPAELMEMITPHLNRREIIALRHGSRRLSMTTSEALIPTFEYLSTSCSRIGLGRLRALALYPDNKQRVALFRTIKRITVHLPTPAELEGVAKWLPPVLRYPFDNENPYLEVYAYMRRRLHLFLSLCPNLERLIVTNEPLEYDSNRLGYIHNALPLRRAPRLLEIDGIDPFLAAVEDSPKWRPRTYGYEVVLGILDYLPRWLPLNIVINHKYTRELEGHAFMTWDFKNGYPGRCHPQLHAVARLMFGSHLDGQIDIPEILQTFLMGVTFKNGEKVDKSAHKHIYRYLEQPAGYKLTFENTDYFPNHISSLTHLTLQNSELSNYMLEYMLRQDQTLDAVEFLQCRCSPEGWNYFLCGLSYLPLLSYVRVVKGSVEESDFEVDKCFTFSFIWQGTPGWFVDVCQDLDDVDDIGWVEWSS